MKKRMMALLMASMLLSVNTLTTVASPITSGNGIPEVESSVEEENKLTYRVLDDGTAEITGHTYEENLPNDDFVIPSEIDGYKVSSIGKEAFKGFVRNTIGKLVISEGIVHIGEGAFSECSGFTGDLNIPDSVTEIGEGAFEECWGFDGILRISSNISLGDRAFSHCYNFSELILPENLGSIGDYVFAGCGFTGELVIPESVTSIGAYAFSGCRGFTGELVIPESVTSIGEYAFVNCIGFTGELVIPESVISIGKHAFRGCSGFTGELVIPESVTTIGEHVFEGCSGFTGDLVIPESVTSIGENAFKGCSGFTGNLVIPEGVASIGSYAFSGCSGFTGDLVIPEGVVSIGSYAFSGCSGFTGELVIPKSVTSIDGYAFSGCSGFTGDLVIPESVTTINTKAFEGCSGFTGDLIIPEGVVSIVAYAFEGCSGFTGDLVIPESVTSIGQNAFKGCSGFTGELVIPESVTSIAGNVFEGCSGFTGELVIPESVTSIGSYAFSGCSGFTGELVIPEGVVSIDSYAFSGCSGFTGDLVIPEGVTSITAYTFSGCSGFNGELMLPEGVIYIHAYAFSGCSGFNGELVLPESVSEIRDSAFSGCSGFNGDLTIPEKVSTIGDYAFKDCSGLGRAEIAVETSDVTPLQQKNVLEIETLDNDDEDDIELNYFTTPTGEIELPDSVKKYGDGVFQGCTGLNGVIKVNGDGEVNFPEDVSAFDFTTIKAKPASGAANYAIEHNLFFCPYFSDGPSNTDAILVNGNWMYIRVVDENNAPLQAVTINGIENTNKDGRYAIEFEEGAETMDLEISADGYYDYRSSIEVEKGGIETILMVVNDGTLSLYKVDVWASGSEEGGKIKNLLTDTMTIERTNTLLDGTEGSLYVNVNSSEDMSEVSFEVIQGDKKWSPQEGGGMLAFPITWEGDVILTNFRANEPVYVRIKDEKGNQITSKIGLRIVSEGALTSRNTDFSVSLSKKEQEISVPESIPFIGGTELKFDFSNKLPVKLESKKDKDGLHVKIAVNKPETSTDTMEDWEKKYNELINMAEKNGVTKEFLNGKFSVSGFRGGMIDPPEVTVIGYGEGIFKETNGKNTYKVDVGIFVGVEMGVSRTYYTFVTWIPVYITFGAEGKLTADIKVGELTISDDEITLGVLENADLGLELALIPRAGIGAEDIISVGIAGNGTLETVYSLASSNLTKATVQAKAYIYGDLFGHELKNELGSTKPYDLLKGEVEYEIDSSTLNLYNSSAYRLMERGSSAQSVKLASADAELPGIVQTAAYPGAEPKLVMVGDTRYLFWLQDIATRNAENRAALIYSTSTDGNTWTTPKQLVEESVNQTMDGNYDVEVIGDKIYVCWQDGAEIYTAGQTLNEMIQKLYVSYAIVDGISGEVLLTDTVTEQMGAFFNPQIAVQNGKVKIAFVKTEMTTDSGIWNASNTHSLLVYDEASDTVTTFEIGNAKEKIMSMDMISSDVDMGMVYVVDLDGDYSTIDDRKICTDTRMASDNGSQQYLMSETGQISGVTAADNVYYWNVNGKIYYAEAGESQSHTLYTNDVVVPSDFTVVSDGTHTTLLWEEIHPETAKVVINGIRKSTDGWTLPFTVGETTGDMTAELSSCYHNGTLEYAYLHAAMQEDGSFIYSICVEAEKKRCDISLDYAEYDSLDFSLGEVLPIRAHITNRGNQDVDSVNVYWDDTLLGSVETSILVGESAIVELNNYTVPENVTGYEEHFLTVSTELETNTSDNNYTMEIGKTDLSVICNQRMQRGDLWVDMAVNNTSPISTGAVLNIRANYKDGKILYTEDLGTIEGNHAVYLTHSFAEFDKTYCDYYIEVVPTVADATDWNNIELVYTGTGRDMEGGALGYTPVYCTVEFDSNGGTSVESQVVKKGTIVSEPTTPTKENCYFGGWYYNGELYDFASAVQGDITLIAQWEEYSQLAMPSASVESGSSVDAGTHISLNCSLAGASIYYTLDNTMPTTDSILYVEPIILLENTTIKAIAVMDGYLNSEVATFSYVVTKKNNIYTVVFESNGGSVVDSQEVVENSCVTKPEDPVREGYMFLGWYVDEELYDFATPVTGHLRLEAKWRLKEIPREEYFGEVLPEDVPDDGIIPDGIWVAGITDTVYTGASIKQTFRVYDYKTLLKEKKDYTVTYKNNKKVYIYTDEDYAAFEEILNSTGKKKTVGTFNPSKAPQIIVKMKGNYSGNHTIYYKNVRADITSGGVVTENLTVTYSGKKQTPKPVVIWNGKKLKYGTDYYVPEYDAAKKDKSAYTAQGSYDLTIVGKNNFKGEIPVQLIISEGVTQIAFSKVNIKGIKNMPWDEGRQITQKDYKLSYKQDDFTGTNGEYTVTWGTNTDVGKGTVTFTGTGQDMDGDGYSYIGSKTVTFKITGISMKDVEISGIKTSYPYTGSAITTEEVLRYKKDKNAEPMDLFENTHYTVDYQKNIEKGTATIIFTGKESGGFTGTKKATFKITAKGIQDIVENGVVTEQISVSYKDSQNVVDGVYVAPYMKGGARPEIIVTCGNNQLEFAKDYTISYGYNKKIASSTDKNAPVITIKGKGNYAGTKRVLFSIKEKPLSAENGMSLVVKDKIENTKKNGYRQTFKVYDADGKTLSSSDYDSQNVVYTLVETICEDGTIKEVNEVLGEESTVYAGSVIKITVQGKGNYADGEITGTYRILEKNHDISKAVIQIKNQDYTGDDILITKQNQFKQGKIYIKIGNEEKELLLGQDIKVVDGSYVNNRNKGTAKITFCGVGEFGGTKTVQFKIGSKSITEFWRGIFAKANFIFD